jgi:predicted transcriptional regulator
MALMGNNLLISVQHRFALGILDGSKVVELRRVRPSVTRGNAVFLYSTRPQQRIDVYFIVDDVCAARPAQLWRRFGASTGVRRHEFDAYFAGCRAAYALVVGSAHEMQHPVTIDHLRQSDPAFHPPQGYLYLRNSRAITPLLNVNRQAA